MNALARCRAEVAVDCRLRPGGAARSWDALAVTRDGDGAVPAASRGRCAARSWPVWVDDAIATVALARLIRVAVPAVATLVEPIAVRDATSGAALQDAAALAGVVLVDQSVHGLMPAEAAQLEMAD